jgi:hypothetical protein
MTIDDERDFEKNLETKDKHKQAAERQPRFVLVTYAPRI